MQKNRINLLNNLSDALIQENIESIIKSMINSDNIEVAKWLIQKNLLPIDLIIYPWNKKIRIYLNR